MRRYFRNLWTALCGRAVSSEYIASLHARIARYDHRANAQRTARAARANRQPKEIA